MVASWFASQNRHGNGPRHAADVSVSVFGAIAGGICGGSTWPPVPADQRKMDIVCPDPVRVQCDGLLVHVDPSVAIGTGNCITSKLGHLCYHPLAAVVG